MNIFRELDPKEVAEFRKWARENYLPFTPINGTWHPAVQEECVKMNKAARFPSEDIV